MTLVLPILFKVSYRLRVLRNVKNSKLALYNCLMRMDEKFKEKKWNSIGVQIHTTDRGGGRGRDRSPKPSHAFLRQLTAFQPTHPNPLVEVNLKHSLY